MTSIIDRVSKKLQHNPSLVIGAFASLVLALLSYRNGSIRLAELREGAVPFLASIGIRGLVVPVEKVKEDARRYVTELEEKWAASSHELEPILLESGPSMRELVREAIEAREEIEAERKASA